MPSRSRPFAWLVRKEWRELVSSRAWWALLVLTGPLVGISFIAAVNTYGEVSAGAGAGCGFVCNPLDGIWAPTFSAYEIASIFLLPFVAIRLVGGDRQSGAFAIESQGPLSPLTRIAAKALVLTSGWLVTCLAGLLAAVLWISYGGAAYVPEMLVVAFGHLLNAGLTVAIAAAAASMTDHPSTAAIVTLAVTVGMWIIDFAAAIQGGIWTRIAAYTPSALVASFQHGLVQADVVLVALAIVACGLAMAALWSRPAMPVIRRLRDVVACVAVTLVAIGGASRVRASWDASESRRNSFSEPDQEALGRIHLPLTVEVHLAPADARRQELDRQALAKLKRAMSQVHVVYVSRTTSGLFEEADPGYGEIWYDLGGRRVMSRTITDEGVLETVLGLAGVSAESDADEPFRGHPLAARPIAAAAIFYGFWPLAAVGTGAFVLRRQS